MTWRYAVNSNRLCQAADAVLEAIKTSEGLRALARIKLSGPLAREVVAGKVFTQAEVVEAIDLLARLGVVGLRSPRAAFVHHPPAS